MNTSSTAAILFTVMLSFSGPAAAQSPADLAAKEYKLATAVATASRAWRDAFNAGDAGGAAALYEENAIMVVTPIGTFEGREAIHGFWADLVAKGFDDVVYTHTVTRELDEDRTSARVSADWKMNNARGVITNEHWVLQPDGRALLREDHFEIAQ